MYSFQDGSTGWAKFYFLLIVVFGNLFILNLALAVLVDSFATLHAERRPKQHGPKTLERSSQQRQDSPTAPVEALTENGPQHLADLGSLAVAAPSLISRPSPSQPLIWPGKVWHAVEAGCRLVRRWLRRQPTSLTVRNLVEKTQFLVLTLVMIVLNAVVMAVDAPDVSPDTHQLLERVNFGFVLYFVVELLLRVIGLGIDSFVDSAFETIDLFVVLVSLAEMVHSTATNDSSSSSVSIFRAFRLMRVSRLVNTFFLVHGHKQRYHK